MRDKLFSVIIKETIEARVRASSKKEAIKLFNNCEYYTEKFIDIEFDFDQVKQVPCNDLMEPIKSL